MTYPLFQHLISNEFALKFSFISNPRAIHQLLQRSSAIKSLRDALSHGQITEESIRAFSNEILGKFEQGKRFPFEFALAAIAVALETRPTAFAEEFIMDLARLNSAELPIAIRVAREACQELHKLPGNNTKEFSFPTATVVPQHWEMITQTPRVKVEDSQIAPDVEFA